MCQTVQQASGMAAQAQLEAQLQQLVKLGMKASVIMHFVFWVKLYHR